MAWLGMARPGLAGRGSARQDKGFLMTKSIPELSIDTQTLQRLLASVQVGDVVTYDTLTAAIGRDVQHGARGNLRSARQRLLRSEQKDYGVITNVGLKRLDDVGKVGQMGVRAKRIRTQARQMQAHGAAVENFNALPNEMKLRHNVLLAQSAVVLQMTSASATKRLELKITPSASIRPKESLELMKASL